MTARRRWILPVAAAGFSLVSLAPTVAQAASASLKLKAPATLHNKAFDVKAKGKTKGKHDVVIVFFQTAACPKTLDIEINKVKDGSATSLMYKHVGRGRFSKKVHVGAIASTGTGYFCGYIYGVKQSIHSKAKARATKKITFT